MLALRYAAVLALALWTGGLVVVGAVAAPAIFDVLGARGAEGRGLAGAGGRGGRGGGGRGAGRRRGRRAAGTVHGHRVRLRSGGAPQPRGPRRARPAAA